MDDNPDNPNSTNSLVSPLPSVLPEFTNVTCPLLIMAKIPSVRLFIGHYIFPWLFIVGVTGNVLNLLVLNSRGMRTKTNALLSAMAVADLCFFLVLFPSELQLFESVGAQDWFRAFLAHHKMTLTFLTNWFSTASTCMALAVTAERVFAIKMPLHAKFYWKNKRIAVLVILVYLSTLFLHIYNLFWFRLRTYPRYCSDGTYAFSQFALHPVTPNDTWFTYVQVSRIFVPHLSITFPFFVLFFLNGFLLYYLHQNRRAMADATNAPQLRQNELKVGLMVAMIVFTFLLCSAPSVALYIYDAIATYGLGRSPYASPMWYTLSAVSNSLVIVGKASNFVLYCSASSHFRRRLVRIFCRHYYVIVRRGTGRTGGRGSHASHGDRSTIRHGSSSRGSTSQRRTTLTSLFAMAIHNNNNNDQPRHSLGALSGGGRRTSSPRSIENLVLVEVNATPPSMGITTVAAKRTNNNNNNIKSKKRRRHSSQPKQSAKKHRMGIFTLERRRFSTPDNTGNHD